jgi:hypothetical protein
LRLKALKLFTAKTAKKTAKDAKKIYDRNSHVGTAAPRCPGEKGSVVLRDLCATFAIFAVKSFKALYRKDR